MRPKHLQHAAKDLNPPDLPHMVGATATLTSTASAGTDWTQPDPLSSAPFGGVAGQKAKAGAAFLLADGLVVEAGHNVELTANADIGTGCSGGVGGLVEYHYRLVQ